MSNFSQIIEICEKANGAGSKQIIKDALAQLDAIGQKLVKYTMDPFLVYGVKKFVMPKVCASCADDEQDFEQFFLLLDKLAARELTGNAAREAINIQLLPFNERTQNYLARVIDKDFQAGFSAETYNKVHPNNQVYIFDVQLADKCSDADEFEKYITFPCQGDVKYDGLRRIAIVKKTYMIKLENGDVKVLSETDHAELADGTFVLMKNLMVGMDVIKFHHTSGDANGKLDTQTKTA